MRTDAHPSGNRFAEYKHLTSRPVICRFRMRWDGVENIALLRINKLHKQSTESPETILVTLMALIRRIETLEVT